MNPTIFALCFRSHVNFLKNSSFDFERSFERKEMSGDTLARSDTLVNAKWQGKQGYFFSKEEGGNRTALSSVSRVRGSRHRVYGLNEPRGNLSLRTSDKK